MTNEQLNEYERLDTALQSAHDKLTAAVINIASMTVKPGESVMMYCRRLDKAVKAKNEYHRDLETAKAAKMAFLRAV